MSDSSSFHRLNADRGLRSWRKLAYLGANAINAILPNIGGNPRLRVKPFRPPVTREEWFAIDAEASMSRKWSNLFWMRLPWEKMAGAAGPLHILDMGCGRGGYGPRFLQWGGTSVASYTGVEPSAKHEACWRQLMEGDVRLKYIQGSADDIERLLDGPANTFISQSSLEHIEDDLLLFQRVAHSLRERPRKLLQVHLVPSGAALPLYQFHGVRQYTPRTLQRIAGLFPGASVVVYALGGPASWWLQWCTSGVPMLLRRKPRPDPAYQERSWTAFVSDSHRRHGPALFYALVISSGLNGG